MKQQHKKRIIQFLVGILISGIALYYTLKGLNWKTVREGFSTISLPWYFVATGVIILTLWVRAYRWTFFLKNHGRLSIYTLHKGVAIGYFGNNVFPFRLGELLRAYATSRLTGLSVPHLFSTILLERVVDVFSFFFFLLAISLITPLPEWAGNSRFFLALILVLILLTFIFYHKYRQRITDYMNSKTSRFWIIVGQLHEGLCVIFDMKYRFYVFFLSLVLWTLYGSIFWFGFKMFDMDLGLLPAAILLATTSFAISVPSIPGYVGTYHIAVVQTLMLYKIDKSFAFTYAVVVHLVGFIALTLLGLIFYLQMHLSVTLVTKNSETLKTLSNT
ncbi:MAG: lysylphosphatidylglycerol synthase transmembrane domain-containing protein [Candidatus Marinimicrobia bacterium]|nr:lysylphosphatidylglycerol synthase transmembrane domain-containing protein [Candidatus Neomarinimicrobiota bacterium]MDD5582434.1 lysylphosphatidylglycerol synthase transmembrane domain-containing protein [Candidatus Neomarinimicrobiota bacterium]